MMRDVQAVAPQGDAQTIVQQLLGQIRSNSQSEGTKKAQCLPIAAATNVEACQQVHQWLTTNSSTSISSQPAYAVFKAKLRKMLCTCDANKEQFDRSCPTHGQVGYEMCVSDLLFFCGTCVFEAVPAYVPTVALGVSMLNEEYKNNKEALSSEVLSCCSFLTKKEDFFL